MGRTFLDLIGGTHLFACANCDTILTNRSEVISLRFSLTTGQAFLFNMARRHETSLLLLPGCIYEFATEDSQHYKVGRAILERALVRESFERARPL